MIFRIIITIVLLNIGLYAQDLLNIYKPVIPPVCLDSKDERESVSSTLESISKIDPSMIYYYLEHLRIFAEDQSEGRKAYSYLHFLNYKISKKMDEWISNEFDIVYSSTVSFSQWMRIWSYLLFLKDTPGDSVKTIEPNYKINTHYRDYVLCLYYQKSYSEYDKSIDYPELLNSLLESWIYKLTDVYQNPEKYSSEQLDFYYETAKENPFIFRNSILDYMKKTVPVFLTEYLIKLSSAPYLQKNTISLGGQIDAYNDQKNYVFMYSDDRFDIETNLTDLSHGFLFPGISANIRLREYKSYFSSLRFSFYANFVDKKTSSIQMDVLGNEYYVLYGEYAGATVGVRVDPEFKLSPISYSSKSYHMKLSTPLVYLLPELSIEGGLYVRYNSHVYTGTINRQDFYKNRNAPGLSEDLLVKYEKELERKNEKTFFSPLVSLNYTLFNFIDMRLSFHDHSDFAQYEMFFNYNF